MVPGRKGRSPQERDPSERTSGEGQEDFPSLPSLLSSCILGGHSCPESRAWRWGTASHQLSQEPHGWKEAVFSCPGTVSHPRAERKAGIKGPWGQSTSIHSSPGVLTTLYCVGTGECPLGAGAGLSAEDAPTSGEDMWRLCNVSAGLCVCMLRWGGWEEDETGLFFSKITNLGKAEGRGNEEAGNLGRRSCGVVTESSREIQLMCSLVSDLKDLQHWSSC